MWTKLPLSLETLLAATHIATLDYAQVYARTSPVYRFEDHFERPAAHVLHVRRERAFTCSFPTRERAVFRVLNLPPLLPLPPVSPVLPWTAVRGCRSVTVARVHPGQP